MATDTEGNVYILPTQRPLEDEPVDLDEDEPQIVDAHLLPDSRPAERQPIIPDHLRRENLRGTFDAWWDLQWYRIRFHAAHSPKYLWWTLFWGTVGVFKIAHEQRAWWMLDEMTPLLRSAVDHDEYPIFKDGKSSQRRWRKFRGWVIFGECLGILTALVYLVAFAPLWAQILAPIVVLPLIAKHAHPADKPILTRAVLPAHVEPLTSGQIIDALDSLGIARISKAIADDPAHAIRFTHEIHRDGPGWRADFLLPPGATATQIIENRDRFASGLGRPLGAVWPEGNVEISPAAVNCWVGYDDMAKIKQPPWPLLRSGKVNLFNPFPFGTDQRGRTVRVQLIEGDMLIGAMKGAGKTFALREVLLAAALDPLAEIWVYELKGTGDLETIGQVATRYGSDASDDMLEETFNALRDLNAERERRSKVLKRQPRDLRPEHKITEHLASRKDLGLHPLVIAIDECQQLFQHKKYGGEAGDIAEQLIRLGRAVGIIPLFATQRPDKESLPTGVTANAGLRFCLRVMGQVENDMILGTRKYRNGIRATIFTDRDRGIGYLVGQGDPKIVRTYYIDGPAAERVALRARAVREKEGRLNGYALLGEDAARAQRPHRLADDIAAVIEPGEEKVWSTTILERLADLRPGVYDGWTEKRLGSALRDLYKIETRPYSVRNGTEVTNKYAVVAADVLALLDDRQIGG